MGNSVKTGVYLFIVRGFTPEFKRGMAFRREKHFKTANRKILKCPYCGAEFETVDNSVHVRLCCFTRKSKINCDVGIACRTCHKVVGIIYASA